MTLGEHVEELRKRVIHVAIAIVAITIFTMSCGLKPIEYSGIQLVYPFPDPIDNISVSIMHYMQKSLLPEGVRLIQTAPGQAFFAQLNVAVLLGVLGSLPLITREVSAFVAPAIGSKTRLNVARVMVPVLTLFTIGILFSYFVVIPFTLNFLYRYGEAIGVETFLNVHEFIGFVMQFFVGFGLAFQLPVIMYAVSLAGVISPRFWRNNFRYAIIAFVVFGAAITPDGSGITMWFVALPMIALYLVGMAVVENRARKERAKEPRDGIVA